MARGRTLIVCLLKLLKDAVRWIKGKTEIAVKDALVNGLVKIFETRLQLSGWFCLPRITTKQKTIEFLKTAFSPWSLCLVCELDEDLVVNRVNDC